MLAEIYYGSIHAQSAMSYYTQYTRAISCPFRCALSLKMCAKYSNVLTLMYLLTIGPAVLEQGQ